MEQTDQDKYGSKLLELHQLNPQFSLSTIQDIISGKHSIVGAMLIWPENTNGSSDVSV